VTAFPFRIEETTNKAIELLLGNSPLVVDALTFERRGRRHCQWHLSTGTRNRRGAVCLRLHRRKSEKPIDREPLALRAVAHPGVNGQRHIGRAIVVKITRVIELAIGLGH
jgi:hypothetical protein